MGSTEFDELMRHLEEKRQLEARVSSLEAKVRHMARTSTGCPPGYGGGCSGGQCRLCWLKWADVQSEAARRPAREAARRCG